MFQNQLIETLPILENVTCQLVIDAFNLTLLRCPNPFFTVQTVVATYRDRDKLFFLTKSFSSRELLYPLLDQVMATKKKWLSRAC